jgi:hypothetical protein
MCVQFISWNVLATVLNANWIVTAAHCVNEYIFFIEKTNLFISYRTDSKYLLAEFGIHDRYSVERSRVTRMIKQIVIACIELRV